MTAGSIAAPPLADDVLGAERSPGRFVDVLRRHLPSGAHLPDSEHRARHRIVMLVLAALSPVLVVVAEINDRRPWAAGLVVLGAVAGPAVIARVTANRRLRSVCGGFALMAAAAVLVVVWNGRTEAHFLFFVLLPLVSLYQDWLVFAVAVATIVVHHAVVGSLAPQLVYDHTDSAAHPIIWAAIHGAFILGLTAVLIMYWKMAETHQRALQSTLHELQATQMQLVHAQKLESIGELAAGVAHEINTPIQFIGDNLEFLQTSFADLVAVSSMIDRLVTSARELDVLADDCDQAERLRQERDFDYLVEEVPLALAQSLEGAERVAEIVRALKGVAHPNIDSLGIADPNEMVRNTIVVTRNEWKHVASVQTDFAHDVPQIACFPGPLSQVFLNMIVNATHAIDERYGEEACTLGRIVVATRTGPTPDTVSVSISDNGSGISPDHMERIFDPFFTTKPQGKGTGQGLSISWSVVVNQHHGRIDVESRVGEGTTFTIVLPGDLRADLALADAA